MNESSWLWTECGVNGTKYTTWGFHGQWWLSHVSMNNCHLIKRKFNGFLWFQLELAMQKQRSHFDCAWRKQMCGENFIQSGCSIFTTASTTSLPLSAVNFAVSHYVHRRMVPKSQGLEVQRHDFYCVYYVTVGYYVHISSPLKTHLNLQYACYYSLV